MPRPKAAKRRQPANITKNKKAATEARTNIELSRHSILPPSDDTHDGQLDTTAAAARLQTPRRESRQPNYNRNNMTNERTPNSCGRPQAPESALRNSIGRSKRPWEPRASMNRPGNVNSKISTPGMEASILSAFRPRPRQPSILQIVGNDDSSDLDEEDFLGHLDSNDESTPFNISKRKILPLDTPASPIAQPKLSPEKSHREKSRSPSMIPDSYPNQQDEDEDDDEDGDKREASVREASVEPSIVLGQPSPSPQPQSSPIRQETTAHLLPQPQNSILKSPSLQLTLTQDSDLYSSSPAQPEPIEPSKPVQLPTSKLQQNLLPRRTRRSRKPENSGASTRAFSPDALGESLAPNETSRAKSRSKKTKNSVDENPSRSKRLRPSKDGTRGTSIRIEKTTASTGPANRVQKSKKNNRTYSRQSDLDKENLEREPSPTEPLSLNEDGSEELLQQKAKFAEIDEWSMDFEDVSPEEYIY